MFRHTLVASGIAMMLATPAFAADDLSSIRAEIDQLRQQYEKRIAELETRLQSAEAKADAAQQTAQAAAVPPPAPPARSNSFNPDVSLILQGQYAHLDDIEHRNITGFLSAGDEDASRGFSIDESELVLSASIDPYFRGYFNAAVDPGGGIEVEEAWFETTALGHGLTAKAGRFLSALGYQNIQHPHAWDFATNNLMYTALFGGAYTQNGAQLKWVAPTDLFMEFGAEMGNGDSFPSTDNNSNGWGDYTLFSHFGGDVGASHSWTAGLSYLYGKARGRESGLTDLNGVFTQTTFSGTSKNWVADFVWKWAPEGNMNERNFKFAAEYFWRDEDGRLLCADDTAEGGACNGTDSSYSSSQHGGYLQGVYQFMPRWRVGYRYDWLSDGDYSFGANNAFLPVYHYSPTANTAMLDYSPSEFSRFRLQYTRSEAMTGITENQWFVQYIQSLGAHGAHKF